MAYPGFFSDCSRIEFEVNVKQIIAIGGGGFSKYGEYSPLNSLIEEYCLQQTRKSCPTICFIPTASGEAQKYIIDFYRFFGQLNCKPSHLSLFDLPSSDLESFILEKDAIYVGGGNTKSCLALWKEWKLDIYLKKAWEAGVVLSGISAGANCWFEECITDSIPGNLTALKCLGFLKGSCCPHYDGEKDRRPTYHQLLQEGKLLNGLAIDDHVALHYIEDQLACVVRANEEGSAYKVEKRNQKIHEERLESIFIGAMNS